MQRCRPGRERGVGSWSCSSSSSLELFKEAISGRAGNSYHSLLTPGRQEGESASPPHPHRARRAGTTRPHGTPKQGYGVPKLGGSPQCAHPNDHSNIKPFRLIVPYPASLEEGREWEAPVP